MPLIEANAEPHFFEVVNPETGHFRVSHSLSDKGLPNSQLAAASPGSPSRNSLSCSR